MISKTAEYALKVTLLIACQQGDQPLRAKDAAELLELPANYLSKILHALARKGVLTSGRGPRGGFRIARPPEQIRLLEVVNAFDDLDGKKECLLGRTECTGINPCAAHFRWAEIKDQVHAFFDETTIADMIPERAEALGDV